MPEQNLKINRHIVKVLEESINQLDIFCDPHDLRCDISPAVRDAARLWLFAHVHLPLDGAIKEITRETNYGKHIKSQHIF